MRNFFSILIFLSLAIAIGITGRHLSEIKNYFQKKKKNSFKKMFWVSLLISLGKKIIQFFLFWAEELIKRFKNLLHLTHFWLIKLRKKKQKNEELREIEAKMELLEEEEKNLEKVINEDLGQEEERSLAERFKKKTLDIQEDSRLKEEKIDQEDLFVFQKEEKVLEVDFKEPSISGEEVNFQEETKIVLEKRLDVDEKINRFFSGNEINQNEEGIFFEKSIAVEDYPVKKQFKERLSQSEKEKLMEEQNLIGKRRNFFSNLINKFKLGSFKKRPEWEKDFPSADDDVIVSAEKDFSDGIVRIGEISEENYSARNFYQEENNLIKEVVKVEKKKEEYSDEDLGVDREILERKIINKISLNPKDQENYRQLGDLYLKMENFRDAEECYQQVLKIKPRDIAAKRKLERVRLLKRLRQR